MWYPIRSATQRSMVHARFEALGIPKMLFADLAIHPDDAGLGLAGSGLIDGESTLWRGPVFARRVRRHS